MLRRRPPTSRTTSDAGDTTPAQLFRAPIISDHLIVRESTRADASAIERSMDAAELQGGGVTIDGARRFGSALAEVPVWAASRAVCEMGTAEIVGGLVLTPVRSPSDRAQRIGWWLIPRLRDRHPELLEAVIERLRSTGTVTAVMHLRTDASDAITAAEHTGFVRGHALEHTIGDGRSADFWEYARPIAG